jgi:PEP-CTERM motif
MLNLNTLIDPTLGITLYNAQGINDNGQIVANNYSNVYLLTPVPEPCTLTLFGVAVWGFGVWARRRKQ